MKRHYFSIKFSFHSIILYKMCANYFFSLCSLVIKNRIALKLLKITRILILYFIPLKNRQLFNFESIYI